MGGVAGAEDGEVGGEFHVEDFAGGEEAVGFGGGAGGGEGEGAGDVGGLLFEVEEAVGGEVYE